MVNLQKRLKSQLDLVAKNKSLLDAALANRMPSLATDIDERLKRQTASAAATRAAIEEVERGIQAIDDEQMKLELEAAKPPAPPAEPPAKRR